MSKLGWLHVNVDEKLRVHFPHLFSQLLLTAKYKWIKYLERVTCLK